MSNRRTSYGERKYETRVEILGTPVLLGYYRLRAEVKLAEQVALTIRKALANADIIKRKKSNLNQTEQAA